MKESSKRRNAIYNFENILPLQMPNPQSVARSSSTVGCLEIDTARTKEKRRDVSDSISCLMLKPTDCLGRLLWGDFIPSGLPSFGRTMPLTVRARPLTLASRPRTTHLLKFRLRQCFQGLSVACKVYTVRTPNPRLIAPRRAAKSCECLSTGK